LVLAALVSWLLTAAIGGYMLRTWIVRGGLRLRRATKKWAGEAGGVPPAVVFCHAGAALAGLAVWAGYLAAGWHPLAWAGVALISAAIALGICTVTLWTPYPVRHDPLEEMIAGLPSTGPEDPFQGRQRPRLHLSPLIPAGHGIAALTTFMLAVLAAATPRG
jgi:manganese efflux pump family protein